MQENEKDLPQVTFPNSGVSLGDGLIEIYFPGAGHTKDNLVVWLPAAKLLFGGCLVRSLADKNLGYLGEASVDEWEHSVKRLIAAYPEAITVIPGHGQRGGFELLAYTQQLAKMANQSSIHDLSGAPAD